MTIQYIRLVVFMTIVAVIYYWAFRIVICKLSHKKEKKEYGPKIMRKPIIFAAILGTLCIFYGYFVEPFLISTTNIKLSTPKLSSSIAPLRIVHISDLHISRLSRREMELMDIIQEASPDLVIITGDFLNSEAGMEPLKQVIDSISTRYGIYAIFGNYDSHYRKQLIKNLPNVNFVAGIQKIQLDVNDYINICGVNNEDEGMLENVKNNIKGGVYNILITHKPDFIEDAAKFNPDLYLCGHTHGGQVRLPYYGALVTLSKFDKKYESGQFKLNKMDAYVSRGIGLEGVGSGIFSVRFLCRPEVVIIDVYGIRK